MKRRLLLAATVLLGCSITHVQLPGGMTVDTKSVGPGHTRVCRAGTANGVKGVMGTTEGATGGTTSGTTTGPVVLAGTGDLTGACVDVQGATMETTTVTALGIFFACALAAFVAL